MSNAAPVVRATCKSCNQTSEGRFCSNCGQALATSRITIKSILHEIFHLFTHLDHGILYTIRMLILTPGKMQRDYIDGDRIRHQKPFSMYFLTATIVALGLYWINKILVNYYHAGSAGEVLFFNKYLVALLLAIVPINAALLYLFFFRSGRNFAELLVLELYTTSMVLLIVLLIQPVKLIWPDFDTRYIEPIAILIYSVITNYNFFDYQKKWIIVAKAILRTILFYLIITNLQDAIVELYMH